MVLTWKGIMLLAWKGFINIYMDLLAGLKFSSLKKLLESLFAI